MPIAPELRQFYRTPEWFAARKKCQDRANGRCEWCGKPKGRVRQALDHSGRWFDETRSMWMWPPSFRVNAGDPLRFGIDSPAPRRVGMIRCVLTTAHLDHNPQNNADENLAGLCQRCHLLYDGPHHRMTARLRRDKETGQLRLELVG